MFNWLETVYPTILTPRGVATQTSGSYTYRYYRGAGPGQAIDLGVDGATGNQVYETEAAKKVIVLGPLSGFLAQAAAAGF